MDPALRLKILEKRAQEKRATDPSFEIPDEVVALLADRLTESGRELEGAINRLYLTWQLMRAPVTLDIAETIIRDLVQGIEPRRIKIEDILRIVSRHFAVSKQDILSQRRHRSVVRPRQIGMYLAKHLTSRSLPEIGRRFGDRDHTTVLHAIRKIDREVGENPRLKDEIEELKRQLQPLSAFERQQAANPSARGVLMAGRMQRGGAARDGAAPASVLTRARSPDCDACGPCQWRAPRSTLPRHANLPSRSMGFLDLAKTFGRASRRRCVRPQAESNRRGKCMKLVIERGELLRALGHVTSVVERRTTIPILSNVLLKASGRALQFKATDLEREVSDEAPADVSQPGAVTVPAHILHDIVRKLPDGAQVEIKRDAEKERLTLRSGQSRFTLQTLAPEDFPDLAAGEFSHKFEIDAKDLQAPDRQDALCHLHRGDALLPQRHLSAHRPRAARSRPCARWRPTGTVWRRPSCRCPRAPTACRASSCRARPCTSCIA